MQQKQHMFNIWFKLDYRPRGRVISNSPPQNWHLSLICTKTNASCDLSLNVSSLGHLAKCAYFFSLTYLTRLKLFQLLRKIHKLPCAPKGNVFYPQISFSNEKKRAVQERELHEAKFSRGLANSLRTATNGNTPGTYLLVYRSPKPALELSSFKQALGTAQIQVCKLKAEPGEDLILIKVWEQTSVHLLILDVSFTVEFHLDLESVLWLSFIDCTSKDLRGVKDTGFRCIKYFQSTLSLLKKYSDCSCGY